MIFVEQTTRVMNSINIKKVGATFTTITDVDEKGGEQAVEQVLDYSAKQMQEYYAIYWAFDEKSFKAVSKRWPDTDVIYISAKAL